MQLLAYILIYPILWFVSILPFRLLYTVSDLLYILMYHVFRYRKQTVKDNLRLVFPEKSDLEIKTITKKFFHHFCDMILESIKSMTISLESMKARYTFKNLDIIKDFEKQNKSIVVMCAHYGSWEWIFILQTYTTHRGYAVYKRLQNKYFDRLIKSIRARYNSYLITTKETFSVLEDAKKNGILSMNGFISDQTPKKEKARHWNEFMGINVPVHTGAEALAKKLDMPVLFFSVERKKRGYYEATFQTLAENPADYKDYEITDKFLKLVETQIHEAPEYYLWTHKRWKHRKV
ncbi:MAG: lysophospholipid acyltransferase family protein [Flavobacteriaceae bacterium]|jgi:Kdo2-lipid IVA lauroyltransferase/acyltransferase|nr:lysophospholipid acyltransferase family protein [Flavobacteriaceae bacterium]MDA7848582.1 lysophospholipid acyltransferase family protein [Flavobacteriaceae bacterium]MDG1309627.1 lysophospholipid acyltransferase family protein [Flavobacteriaceae bacterium]